MNTEYWIVSTPSVQWGVGFTVCERNITGDQLVEGAKEVGGSFEDLDQSRLQCGVSPPTLCTRPVACEPQIQGRRCVLSQPDEAYCMPTQPAITGGFTLPLPSRRWLTLGKRAINGDWPPLQRRLCPIYTVEYSHGAYCDTKLSGWRQNVGPMSS